MPQARADFDLPARHGEEGAAKDLRLIGGGAERERQDSAVEGVAQERPE